MAFTKRKKRSRNFGWVETFFEVLFEIITFPFKILWEIIKFPFSVLGNIFDGF